jgi:hypothetical protein
MQASGQLKPVQSPESEVQGQKTEKKSKVQSPKSKVQSQRPDPGLRTQDSGLRTQDSADQTYAERVQALLRHVGKSSTPPDPKTKGFQSIPVAQADPARVIDFTQKRKKEDPPPEDRGNRPGATEKKEQDPAIRSVQWTQIKKKDEEKGS